MKMKIVGTFAFVVFFILGYLGVRYLFGYFDDKPVKDSEKQHISATVNTSPSTNDNFSNDTVPDDEDISVQNNDFDTFTGEKAASDIQEVNDYLNQIKSTVEDFSSAYNQFVSDLQYVTGNANSDVTVQGDVFSMSLALNNYMQVAPNNYAYANSLYTSAIMNIKMDLNKLQSSQYQSNGMQMFMSGLNKLNGNINDLQNALEQIDNVNN